MLHLNDVVRSNASQIAGPCRAITIGAASVSNTTAGRLTAGRWAITVTTNCYFVQGATALTAAATTARFLYAGTTLYFNVPDDVDLAFVAVIQDTAGGTGFLGGVDETTARIAAADIPAFA